MMKRFALALLAIVLAVPAWAEINTRQNGDGTADHVGRRGGGVQTGLSCVGGTNLQTVFSMIGLSTGVVISPITDAVIRNIVAGRIWGQTSGQARLTFWTYAITPANAAAQVSPVQFRGMPSGQVSQVVIDIRAGGITQTSMLSTIAQMNSQRVTNDVINLFKHTVGAGDIIAVQSDGGATAVAGSITGQAIITLCPR